MPQTAVRGEEVIAHALKSGWLIDWQDPVKHLLDTDLDAGETDCINIAME